MRTADPDRDIDRRSPSEIAKELRSSIQGQALLVGPGQFSPHAGHARVTILAVDAAPNREPHVLWNRFFPRDALDSLRTALALYAHQVLPAEFDTMYATPWGYAWTVAPAPLYVYDPHGCVVQPMLDAVSVRHDGSMIVIARGDIVQVQGWLSPDWHRREVQLMTRTFGQLVVAATEEAMALADPTYDGIDLMCDASWVGQLGKSMAHGLNVPYVVNDRALE